MATNIDLHRGAQRPTVYGRDRACPYPARAPTLDAVYPARAPILDAVYPELAPTLDAVYPEFAPTLAAVYPELAPILAAVYPELAPILAGAGLSAPILSGPGRVGSNQPTVTQKQKITEQNAHYLLTIMTIRKGHQASNRHQIKKIQSKMLTICSLSSPGENFVDFRDAREDGQR